MNALETLKALANDTRFAMLRMLLAYQDQRYNTRTLEQGKALADLLWWITHEGQVLIEPLGYARLPQTALARTETILRSMRYGSAKFRP